MNNFEKFHNYYFEKITQNPFYPITKSNLHKINKYVITIKGLEYFNELRRKFILNDSNLTTTELANLGKLWQFYASTNRKPKEIQEWNNYIFRVGKMINLLKEKTSLVKGVHFELNKEYEPTQMEYHRIWTDVILKKMSERDPYSSYSYCDKCEGLIEDNFYGYSNDDDLHLCKTCNMIYRS